MLGLIVFIATMIYKRKLNQYYIGGSLYVGLRSIFQDGGRFYDFQKAYNFYLTLYSLINDFPSLSNSPGTFRVDCNVAGAFLENRPKFNFLQNSSDFFFFFHLSSIATIIF